MNWIERMYELKGRDLYSQNGEGLYLEYIEHSIPLLYQVLMDIGAGDGFVLSNTKHLVNLGWKGIRLDKSNGNLVTRENIMKYYQDNCTLVSIDIDGNDFWVLDELLMETTFRGKPRVIIAEFNASYTDSRTIAYNPNHEWAGDSYYGFTFEAGVKLAEKHGYKVIFQIADMNIIMVRKDLIEGLYVPPVTFKQSNFFKMSERTDWIMI